MIEHPDRVTAFDIMSRLREVHDKIATESWTDPRRQGAILTGVRMCMKIIDKEYLQEE